MGEQVGKARAVVLSCIDYRFVEARENFIREQGLLGDADVISLAGGSLATTDERHELVIREIQIARDLHGIEEVHLLDHVDCGAFTIAFGKIHEQSTSAEIERHAPVMIEARRRIAGALPGVVVRFWILVEDGRAIEIAEA